MSRPVSLPVSPHPHGSGGAHPRHRLSVTERLLLHATTLAVGLSGATLAVVKYLLPAPDDPFVAFNHPSQPTLLHAHVLAGPVLVFVIGWIARDHIVRRMRDPQRRRCRRSGVLTTFLMLPMVGSGYLLQVVTAEGARRWMVWIHIATGVVFLLTYAAHAVLARWTAADARAAHLPRAGRMPDTESIHPRDRAGIRRPA